MHSLNLFDSYKYSMKNTVPTSLPIDKIYEVITSQTKKFQIRRKLSATNEKRPQANENTALLIESQKERQGQKPSDSSFNEEEFRDAPQERTASRDNKGSLRLPVINSKKNGSQFEGSQAKAKTESMDDLATKFLNVRPLKYGSSPMKNPDSAIRSMKSVKTKRPLKSESLKDGVWLQAQEIPAERVNAERKLKTVTKRATKDFSMSKNEGEKREVKSGSISQTMGVLPVSKRKYSINYLDFCLFLSLLNNYSGLHSSNGTYRAFVGKGNNSILIKNTLKSRFWWNICENDAEANLNWQQSRDNKFIQMLKSFTRAQQIKEGAQEIKEEGRQKFWLQRPKQQKQDKLQAIKQFTRSGFLKLTSDSQSKQLCKGPFQAQLPIRGVGADCANRFKLHNHFQFNWNITNKKALYYNLKRFYLATKQDPFQFIPLTFHVQADGDAEWQRFQAHFCEKEGQLKEGKGKFCEKEGQLKEGKGKFCEKEGKEGKGKKKREKNLWIVKPGENSNQGCGIQVAQTLQQIKQIIKSKESVPNGKKRSHIIQRYLMPLLYNRRKFDIRCYIVVTSVNDILKAYWYEQGYIRTSCKEFTLKNLKNRFIHLTNDAVQKKSEDYGKYENANKISFADFEKYLESNFHQKQYSFAGQVYPKMMRLAADAIRSVHSLLDGCRRQFTFQIFGLDFMIDEEFGTWLIEVNNNPCLELCSPLLARIIPNMVENAFKIAVDPLFPPPREYPRSRAVPTELFEGNKFTLIFNSLQERERLKQYVQVVDPGNLSNIIESDEQEDDHEECP